MARSGWNGRGVFFCWRQAVRGTRRSGATLTESRRSLQCQPRAARRVVIVFKIWTRAQGECSLSRRRQVVAQCAAASDRAPLFAIAIGWSVYHAALTTTAVAGLGEIVRLQRLALLRVVTTCSQFGRIGSVARLGWAV